MPIVRLKDNEPFESGMRRFNRTIEKIGLLTELGQESFTKSQLLREKENGPPR